MPRRGADVIKIIDQLLQRGWTWRNTKTGSHIQLRSPDGKTLVNTAITNSTDWRGLRNFKAALRRAGETFD